MSRILLILSCSLLAGLCRGQLDNTSLLFNTVADTTRENELFIKIQNLNYLKNNEYSNAMVDGYTLFGYQFNPQLGYKFSRYLSLEAGIFVNKDFGNNRFTQVSPTFSLRYHKNGFKMIFGNIDGSLNHQLIEPIYNFERVFSNRLESGLQFGLTRKYFGFDIWVDWQNMIYRFSNEKEKLVAGLSMNVLKLKNDRWEFRIPLQGLVIHTGGQIDTLRGGSSTDYNGAAGIVLDRRFDKKFLKHLYLDVRYVLRSNNYYDGPNTVETWGDGWMWNFGMKGAYRTNLMLSYWHGDSYYAEFGGDLYSSLSRSVFYPWYSQRIRELMILRLTKQISLAKGIDLMLRAEPYYDFGNTQFEYSYGFYISIDERFWLKGRPVSERNSP